MTEAERRLIEAMASWLARDSTNTREALLAYNAERNPACNRCGAWAGFSCLYPAKCWREENRA